MPKREISTEVLRRAQLPAPQASWDQIQHFALTFDGYKRIGKRLSDLANHHLESGTTPTGLDELRGCLFFEQRRWRHLAEEPDKKAMRHIRRLIAGIGSALAQLPADW